MSQFYATIQGNRGEASRMEMEAQDERREGMKNECVPAQTVTQANR